MLRLLSTVRLDYERQASYQFAVVATDSRGRTAEANVTIELENENDNEPLFTEMSFNFTVPENSLPGENQEGYALTLRCRICEVYTEQTLLKIL